MDEEISVPMHSSCSDPESVIWTCQGQYFAADPSLLITFYGFKKSISDQMYVILFKNFSLQTV